MKLEVIRDAPVNPPIKEVVVHLTEREATILHLIGGWTTGAGLRELIKKAYTGANQIDEYGIESSEISKLIEGFYFNFKPESKI